MALSTEEKKQPIDFLRIDVKKLDFFLYFSSPIYKRESLQRLSLLYTDACAYGVSLSRKYPFNPYESGKTARIFEVAIIPYREKKLSRYDDKAYYDPSRKEIYWNPLFPAYLLKDTDAQRVFKNEEAICAAVLTHEFFHVIEELFELPADEYLCRIHKGRVNPIFREIAAFAFTNAKLYPLCSQCIDLLQIKIENPQYYALCLEACI